MNEQDKEKLTRAVDRYKEYEGDPHEPYDKVFWGTAWPARYYVEARERFDIIRIQPIKAFIGLYKSWQLYQLNRNAIYDGPEDSETKNFVALNGLRYLRGLYEDLPLDPQAHIELDRLDESYPENPMYNLFEEIFDKIFSQDIEFPF